VNTMPMELRWTSEITAVGKNSLVTKGVDQSEIIADWTYDEMVYLLLFGIKPSKIQANMLRAVIVSHCSHGITGQSTMAVRMAADCRSPFLNSALAGFLAGSGDFHQGALTRAMQMIEEASVGDLEAYLSERIKSKQPLFGYGHRFHSKDPRAVALMRLCDENHFCGKNVQIARKMETVISSQRGVFMNIEAAGGAILLDLGFPSEIAPLIILIGRAPMYAATYLERLRSDSRPFQRLSVYDIVPEKGTT
jgi:citrate synthase